VSVLNGVQMFFDSVFQRLASLAYILFATVVAFYQVDDILCVTVCIVTCDVGSAGDFASGS